MLRLTSAEVVVGTPSKWKVEGDCGGGALFWMSSEAWNWRGKVVNV